MRIAVVLASLHHRAALEAGPLDVEWLEELKAGHDLEVFVDQATAGSERLRGAGVPVSVSIKRAVEETGGRRVSADALQARALRRSHERAPFDAILYGSDVTTDLAWFESGLSGVPRGVALGSGLAHDLRAVWEDRLLFSRLSRRFWSWTGLVASADFLLSDVPAEVFGLCGLCGFGLSDGRRLPPRYTTGAPAPQPVESLGGPWVAVAATSLGAGGLEGLVKRVVDRVPPGSGTTYLIVTRPHLPEGRSLEKALLGGCPESLRRRIVVAAAGDDGVAADFLAAADVVLPVSAAELAVPGVASAARRCGRIPLDEAPPSAEPAGAFPATLPARRDAAQVQVLAWETPASRLRQALEEIGRDLGAEDLLVLHADGRAGPAARLLALGYRGVDVVVWGRPDAVLGQPDPAFLYPHALAVCGAAVPAVARAIEECESIWDLVCWAVRHEWIDRLRLLVLPAPVECEFREVCEVERVDTLWRPRAGLLPAPRWIPSVAREPAPPHAETVRLPSRRYSPPSAAPRVALEDWARRVPWPERIRLALPWRWGVLERAMRGRW
jgi:hypothetical protein